MSNANASQTQKTEAVSNDIESELIKLTTTSKGGENSSIHSSAIGRGPPIQASFKSETGNVGVASIKSGDTAGFGRNASANPDANARHEKAALPYQG